MAITRVEAEPLKVEMRILLLLFLGVLFYDGCGPAVARMDNSNLAVPPSEGMPTPAKEKKIEMERESLAKLVDKADPVVAAFVRDPAASIETYDLSVGNGLIYRISKFAPTRMLINYIGVVDGKEAIVLTGNADSFVRFAYEARAMLGRSEERLEYGRAYLLIAVAGSKRLQILDSIDSVKPRPNLNEQQVEAFRKFQDKFADTVKPAFCDGEHCKYFAIAGQDLVLFDLTINSTGAVNVDKKVLEPALLIPYAM